MLRWPMSIVVSLHLALSPPLLQAEEENMDRLLPGRGEIDEFDTLALVPGQADEPARLIIGDVHGFLHVFERHGDAFEETWTSEYFESAISGLIVIDINNDDLEDLVVFTDKGRFHYLDLKAFNTIWSNPPNEYERITDLTISNIDEDEQPELIFCADGQLIIYDAHHKFEEWRSDQTNLNATDILIGDVDGDGADEIVLNTGYVFDARFHDLEWQSPEPFGQHMGILDIDNDGIVELVGEFGGRFIKIFDIDLRREKSIKP